MASRSTVYRAKLKERDPQKYAEYLKKQRDHSKRNRKTLKEALQKRHPTADAFEKKKHQLELQRKRQAKYEAKKRMNFKENVASASKSPRVKTETRSIIKAKREYWTKIKRKQRANMSTQKRTWERKKDRERKAAKKAKQTKHENSNPKEVLQKAQSKENDELGSKSKNSKGGKAKPRNIAFAGEFALKMKAAKKVMKRYCRSNQKVKRKTKVNVSAVRDFYKREDISRITGQKRYATKEGPGHLMLISIRAAHAKYLQESTSTLSLSKFAALRPRNVKKITASQREYCCCVYCANSRYKLLALNLEVKDSTKKHFSEHDVNDIFLCPKSEAMRYHKRKCIDGSCGECHNYMKTVESYYKDIPENVILKWNRWEKSTEDNKRILISKRGKKKDLLTEFVNKDITHPAQGINFFQHLHNARWQSQQFQKIKSELPDSWTLQVMDFAKNRTVRYQDEIKAVFYSNEQITMHPIVSYYKGDRGLVRHASVVISDDNCHDYHAVEHFRKLVDSQIELTRMKKPERKVIYSDGCSSQYKSKGPFADVSLSKSDIDRNYFGSEHGKGDCDAEIGIINRAVDRAIIGKKVIINSASDFFRYCVTNLSVDEELTKRKFLFVSKNEIKRERPETEVKTMKNSRKCHQILNIGQPYLLKTRNLTCFCEHCLQREGDLCLNTEYVDKFELKRLTTEHDMPLIEPPKKRTRHNLTHTEKDVVTDNTHAMGKTRETYFSTCVDELSKINSFPDLQIRCFQLKEEFDALYPIRSFTQTNILEHKLIADKVALELLPPTGQYGQCLPVCIVGDGNCLSRCGSVLAFGHEEAHKEIRARIVVELATNDCYIVNEFLNRGMNFPTEEAKHLHKTYAMFSEMFSNQVLSNTAIRDIYEQEVMAVSHLNAYMGIWQLFALATILKRKVESIYPNRGARVPKVVLSRCILPRDVDTDEESAKILWTSTRTDMTTEFWVPNHFVPLIPIGQSADETDDLDTDFKLSDFVSNEQLMNFLSDPDFSSDAVKCGIEVFEEDPIPEITKICDGDQLASNNQMTTDDQRPTEDCMANDEQIVTDDSMAPDEIDPADQIATEDQIPVDDAERETIEPSVHADQEPIVEVALKTAESRETTLVAELETTVEIDPEAAAKADPETTVQADPETIVDGERVTIESSVDADQEPIVEVAMKTAESRVTTVVADLETTAQADPETIADAVRQTIETTVNADQETKVDVDPKTAESRVTTVVADLETTAQADPETTADAVRQTIETTVNADQETKVDVDPKTAESSYVPGTYIKVSHGQEAIPAVVDNWPYVRFFKKQKNDLWRECDIVHTVTAEDVMHKIEVPTLLMKGSRLYYRF